MHVKRDVSYKMCGTHELSVAFRENHDIEQIGRTGTLVSFFALRFCLRDKWLLGLIRAALFSC